MDEHEHDFPDTDEWRRAKNMAFNLYFAPIGSPLFALWGLPNMITLCHHDNLGVRGVLMALYAYFGEADRAIGMYNYFQKNHNLDERLDLSDSTTFIDASMVLPMAALFYKKGFIQGPETCCSESRASMKRRMSFCRPVVRRRWKGC